MKKLIMLLSLFITIPIFSTQIETQGMTAVFDMAKDKAKIYGAANVLLVFDIDNTLLTANQDFSSYAWSIWQKKLVELRHADAICDEMGQFYQIQNALFTLGRMHPPEADIPHSIKSIQKMGINVMALTSRGPQMRSTTERVLQQNNIFFQQFETKAIAGTYIPKQGAGREVSFQNGIYMTAGQNKGLMLKSLINKLDMQYKVIIFVDDLKKHTQHMQEEFKHMGDDLITYRYGKMDQHINNFLNSDKSKVIAKWHNLKRVWEDIFIKE